VMCLLYSSINGKQSFSNHSIVKGNASVSGNLQDCPEIMADDTVFIRFVSLSALTT